MDFQLYNHQETFLLENGTELPGLEIAYHTFGKLNSEKNNVIWVCHALTANSDVLDWWQGLFGESRLFDPEKYFIVCANILGSCYGSSGPLQEEPETGSKYYDTFPKITIRDMVQAHICLRLHLEIEEIQVALGGSMGGYQVLEWVLAEPDVIKKQVLLCTSARESAWGIAIHECQRMALENDPTWKESSDDAGKMGVKTARAIGMLTYRGYEAFVATQTDDDDILDNFRASSYVQYQGEKLANRFNAYSYWLLTKAMDSHNISRDRGQIENVLGSIKCDSLIVGIKSDILCPLAEQQFLHEHIKDSQFAVIDSIYGHDGFLIEFEQLTRLIGEFIYK